MALARFTAEEGLATAGVSAAVRLNSGVLVEVRLEGRTAGEGFAAQCTLADLQLFNVGFTFSLMHDKGSFCNREGLATVNAKSFNGWLDFSRC